MIVIIHVYSLTFSDFNWTEKLVPVCVEDFNEGTAGPTVSVPECVRDVFQLIFTNTIVDHIVRETNRYACLIMGESKYEKWERVTSDDK